MPVPVKTEDAAPPWRATRQRKVELKEELEDSKYSGVVQPARKKKKLLPEAQADYKSAKNRLIEDLAATTNEEETAGKEKDRLLKELASKTHKEKLAAERKRKMLEELEELERLETEEQERKRQEERRRARVRAEEVAAKVQALLELTAIEEEFDRIMIGDGGEQEEPADSEEQVQPLSSWAHDSIQPWSSPAEPESRESWIGGLLEDIEQHVQEESSMPADSREQYGAGWSHAPGAGAAGKGASQAWSQVSAAGHASGWTRTERWSYERLSHASARVGNEWEDPVSRRRHHAQDEMSPGYSAAQHHSSASSSSSAAPATFAWPAKGKGSKAPLMDGPRVVAPKIVGPRVVAPLAAGPRLVLPPGRPLVEEEQGEDGSVDEEPPQGPRVVAPRVVGARAFRPNLAERAIEDKPVELKLDEEFVPLQRKSEDSDISSFRVVPTAATIRDSMDLVMSHALGTKKKGECIRGRREGDWLALTEEAGYIMIKRGIVNILEEIPIAADWKADTTTEGTAQGNVVVAGIKYSGFVKQFGAGASYAFATSPEIREAFGKDVFITQRELENLIPGQKVSFRVEIHKGRPQAFDIEKLDNKDRGSGLKYKKTKLCEDWILGLCLKPDKCPYAHGEEDLGNDRPTWVLKRMRTLSRAPCFDFLAGSCEKGEGCRFRHIIKMPACFEFDEKGECYRGADCPFQHLEAEATGP